MKKITNLTLLFVVFISLTSHSQVVINKIIFFASDEYSLDNSNLHELELFVDEIGLYSECIISITGHTDQDGSDSYNMNLSRKRAESVQHYILGLGMTFSAIDLLYVGESDLYHSSNDAKSKQKNRRVTLEATVYQYESVLDITGQLVSNNDDEVRIDQSKESSFLLSKGTEVSIPANAFCHLDGSLLESPSVDLTFKEAYSYLDMVDEQLFTQTEDQILETGGMIYIGAEQNGDQLRLRDGESIELKFPEQKSKDGMELFKGIEKEEAVIWEETGQEISSERSNAEEFFIQVDLTPIVNYIFEKESIPDLAFPDMAGFPRSLKKPYPPFRGNYRKKYYQEAYDGYITARKKYEEKLIELPELREKWYQEVKRRKKILYSHKFYFVNNLVKSRLWRVIEGLKRKLPSKSHDKLVSGAFGFLRKETGKISYDYRLYKSKVFGNALKDVEEQTGLTFPRYQEKMASKYCQDFMVILDEVEKTIIAKKYEMGYVDKEVFSKYIVKASSLGWINCDRFIRLQEWEKTNLELANNSKEVHYYLIFKNTRSLLRPQYSKGKVSFNDIPKDEKVRLLALKIDNNQSYLASEDLTTGSVNSVNLTFKKASINKIKATLNEVEGG